MNISLYKMNCDPKLVNKAGHIAAIGSTACTIKGDMSVETPVFEINYNAEFILSNYAYIPEWGKYYFIADRRVLTGKRMELVLKEDYLYTFATGILKADALITRNENVDINDIPDNKLPLKPVNEVKFYQLPNKVLNAFQYDTERSYVLQVLGGVQ